MHDWSLHLETGIIKCVDSDCLCVCILQMRFHAGGYHLVLQIDCRFILAPPSGQVGQILSGRSPLRLERIASWSPPPRMRQFIREPALQKLHNVLADIWQHFEGVTAASVRADSVKQGRLTRYRPSPI
jgi:hypothetical protein